MTFVKRLFWNSEEHRVRALWRLLIQLVVLVILLFLGQAILTIVALGFLAAQQGLSAEQLADPSFLQTFIQTNPLMLMLGTLALTPAIVISVWLAGRLLDRRRFSGFGFHLNRNWWIDFGFGLALGAVLMLLIFLIELAAGWITITGTFATRDPDAGFLLAILPPLVTFLAVGFHEELFSRGYQLQNMAEGLQGLGTSTAIIIATVLSSAIFGVLHATNPNADLRSTVNIVIAGIFLAMGYLLTGELAIPIGLHISWNFFQGNVFGFPVSGTNFRTATFIAIDQAGPELWTGGAFGPEAGLLGLSAIGLGIALTVLWVRWRYGKADLHDPLALPPAHLIEEPVEQS